VLSEGARQPAAGTHPSSLISLPPGRRLAPERRGRERRDREQPHEIAAHFSRFPSAISAEQPRRLLDILSRLDSRKAQNAAPIVPNESRMTPMSRE
jgi:hypothetical protein